MSSHDQNDAISIFNSIVHIHSQTGKSKQLYLLISNINFDTSLCGTMTFLTALGTHSLDSFSNLYSIGLVKWVCAYLFN